MIEAELGRHALGAGLLHEVLVGAGEAGQPVQHRQLLALLGLRRQVDREAMSQSSVLERWR
jgi:hypothetical protein